MKKLSFIFIFILLIKPLWADEGMWLPLLLKQLNEADMKARGMKISAEDIYSINKSSLKDAIVSFGGFCTGEMISEQGLLLTNHHCGYGQVQTHSTVEKDYLTNGFWAMNKSEELPNAGLFVRFIVRMEDVTAQVLKDIPAQLPENERQATINSRIAEITKKAIEGTHYEAIIRPFFYGNEYYMFVTETFTDVRLVGAPPSSIGKFGGDTDNWMWTRHTGDFALFRVYAGIDGKPAPYSANNVPYKPKHFLPISLKGVKMDDFTMVFGFPGRTTEYLPSQAVDLLINETNPHRIKIRDLKLRILDREMKASDAVRIQYAAKYASTANSWKKWIGESKGLKKFKGLEKKKELEAEFAKWVEADPNRKTQYGTLLVDFEAVYQKQRTVNLSRIYLDEAVQGVEFMRLANRLSGFGTSPLDKNDQRIVDFRKWTKDFFKDFSFQTDQKLFAGLMKLYFENTKPENLPASLKEKHAQMKGDWDVISDSFYSQTLMGSEESIQQILDDYSETNIKRLQNDPVFALFKEIQTYDQAKIASVMKETNDKIDGLMRIYLRALREMQTKRKFYPDANSTLRVSFGQVKNYTPKDGVQYLHYTTLDGIMEKEEPDNEDFIVPAKLKELYEKKDYGQYGVKDMMPVCFTASNHTTGGNSGSPVINAEGHLIGTNFDRNWEGTMSDVMYDPEMCRNIAVDIRYTLFIIDKFAGAGHLVKEMKIMR